jgi:hypothetical protein
MTAAAPASDRLGSMTGSQATVGLRGGAVRDSGQQTNSERIRLGPASLEGRVHNMVERVEAHLALLDTAAKKARWSRGRRLGARLAAGEAEQHDVVSSRSGSYSAVAT